MKYRRLSTTCNERSISRCAPAWSLPSPSHRSGAFGCAAPRDAMAVPMFTEIRHAILPLALRARGDAKELERTALLIESLARPWCDCKPMRPMIGSPERDAPPSAKSPRKIHRRAGQCRHPHPAGAPVLPGHRQPKRQMRAGGGEPMSSFGTCRGHLHRFGIGRREETDVAHDRDLGVPGRLAGLCRLVRAEENGQMVGRAA
jgi:hypothetical protein